jgi:hypothetical protein
MPSPRHMIYLEKITVVHLVNKLAEFVFIKSDNMTSPCASLSRPAPLLPFIYFSVYFSFSHTYIPELILIWCLSTEIL